MTRNKKDLFRALAARVSLGMFFNDAGYEFKVIGKYDGVRGEARQRAKKKYKAKLHIVRMQEIKLKHDRRCHRHNRWFQNKQKKVA